MDPISVLISRGLRSTSFSHFLASSPPPPTVFASAYSYVRPSDLAVSLSADRSPSPLREKSSEERASALDALQAPLLGSRAAARRETSVRSILRSSTRRDGNVVDV